jgi:hypothetical protein
MREEIVREIVTRLMTDDEFRNQLINMPGAIIKGYGLDDDEVSALQSHVEGGGLNILEQRLSASMGRAIGVAAGGDCGCGCVTPKKCTDCA